jgi:LacI family transcriptional regulator|tara:strand:+ start:7624 stop:8652 length:1029 start_codon:yes stop_codon:yes gene_type:complete
MKKQITIRDVAEKTGFSFQTVSRIMNGNADLHKPCTVKKVEQAAAELGYVQNLYAKVMQGGRTQSVGMIIDPFTDSFTKDIFSGAHDELMKRDYMPILLLHRDDAHDEKLVKKLASHQVEGLILRPNPNREECSEIAMVLDRYNMPVVSVDYALAKTQKYDFVGTADELGGQIAAEHFLEFGHRRMAGFFTPVDSLLLRQKGFEEAIKRQPGIAPPLLVTDFEFGSEVPAYDRIKSILSEPDAPTAFFAGGDFILPAIYRAANELGLRIPEDLSVIGFGDVDFSRHLVPPATTFKQDAYEIGVHAAQLLIDRIESGDRQIPVREFRFKPQLIQRGSTAPREE